MVGRGIYTCAELFVKLYLTSAAQKGTFMGYVRPLYIKLEKPEAKILESIARHEGWSLKGVIEQLLRRHGSPRGRPKKKKDD
jgi:hypothetical protein